MAARWESHGRILKPSDPQPRFLIPHGKKLDEPPENVDVVRISSISEGCEKAEFNVILDVNSNKKMSELKFQSETTNLSSPSILSHFSSVNHNNDKPVDYIGNHSIKGHPRQNYEMKDILSTCNQHIEVKPHVSYNTHSMLHLHCHNNHSMDRSPNHHSNYSVHQFTCQEDTHSSNDVQDGSNGHNIDLSYYKTQIGFNRLDENVLRGQSNGEELKRTTSHSPPYDPEVKMNRKTEGQLHSSRNQSQQIKIFNTSTDQTRSSPIYKEEKTFRACNPQGDASFCLESINKGSMVPSGYREDPIVQISDGDVTPPCDTNNITNDKQLPKCGNNEEKRASVSERYICSICEKDFRQSGNFHNHMKSHTESLLYCKCGNCGSMFNSAEKLLHHMQKEHTGSNPYKCEHCDRDFSQLNNLRRHLRVHKEKTLKCPFCVRTFNEEYYLTMHVGMHTGLRKYTCGVCKRQFTSIYDLKSHVKTHSKSELYNCSVCSKNFGKACVLRQHMKSHSGNRPFKCVQCNKTFIHRHHLTMHTRSHTESKPFTCETCGKEFSQTSHLNKHKRQHLVELKLSKCSNEDSNGCNEKGINTSIPDELNGEPHSMQQKPKVKPDRKRSRGPTKKKVSAASTAYLHHASQISKANPIQNDSSDPGMFVPLSNEPTQNVMTQMNIPLPSHPPHYNPMYMASTPDVMVAYINWYMMNYPSHSGQGLENEYAEDLSLPKKNQSDESSRPLSLMRDSSPTVNSARNTPISSVPIYQNNLYFHNSTFARPVEVLNCNRPVPVNGPFDLSLPTTQIESKNGSIGENDVEDLSSRGSHRSNSPYATSSVSSQPDMSHYDESGRIDHLKLASTSIMKPHIDQSKLDMQKIKNNESRCNKPVGINGLANSLPNDCSSQNKRKRRKNETHMLNSQDLTRSTAVEDRKLKKCRKLKANGKNVDRKEERYAEEEKQVEDNASQSEISFLKRQIKEVREMIQHEIQKETIDTMTDIEEEEEQEGRPMTLEEDTEIKAPQIGYVCSNKSVVSGEFIQGIYGQKATQQLSSDVRWVKSVETSRSPSTVQTNSLFDILRPKATLPFQRVVNDLDTKDSAGMIVDMSMKHSPAEKPQIDRKQILDDKSACPACLAPMNTESDLIEHLAASIQCYQLYIAKKMCAPASSPSEETVLKLAKKYACQGMKNVSQKPLEEPMDLTDKASSKIKPRTVDDLSHHNQNKYHLFCRCCKEFMLNEVALSLHLSKNARCFHSHYLGHIPVSSPKIDNHYSADSGTLRQIMEPLSGRTPEPTTYKGKKASLNWDMIVSQTVTASEPPVSISSQHLLPDWYYRPIMANYNQPVASSQPHFHLLQQEGLYPLYSGRTLPRDQDYSLPLALVKKEKSSVEPISLPRNCLQRKEKMGEDMRKYVPTAEVGFCCRICYKTFTTSSILEAHQNEHVPQKDGYYTCEFCASIFSRLLDFQYHMLTHKDAFGMHQYNDTTEETGSLNNGESIEQSYLNFYNVKNGIKDHYKCHICGDVFEQVKFFHDHMGTHTGEKPYRCHVCSRGFPFKHNLNRHLMSHNAKTFLCSVCSRGFKGSFYLQMHMKIHAEEKNRRCEICGQHIPKSDLLQHIIAHLGTSDQNPTYDQIGERVKEILKEQKLSGDYISLSAINEHLKKYLPLSEGIGTSDDLMTLTAEFRDLQAGKEKENDGAKCEAKFSTVSIGSISSSTDENKYVCRNRLKGKGSQKKVEQVCPICNCVFKTKREFGNHLGVHNGERTHICKLCGKGFKKRCILRQHEKIHSSDRPFKCEVCGTSFLHFHHLQIHSSVHNGDKPYKCHICGIGFKHSSNLPKHLELHEQESQRQSNNQFEEIQDSKSSKAEIESFKTMTDIHVHERKKERPIKTAESGINQLEVASIENVSLEQVSTEESTKPQSRQTVEDENDRKSQKAKHAAACNGDIT
ncbi:hypothetical protein ACJMK2_024863 [Sinanodonta woodiana]|uniref:C2H2-type domain-containing protein n=1 Tax=Sinanodonta woodiana TaxID=1069815 RepID=A0ABD3XEQ6_SINWO